MLTIYKILDDNMSRRNKLTKEILFCFYFLDENKNLKVNRIGKHVKMWKTFDRITIIQYF